MGGERGVLGMNDRLETVMVGVCVALVTAALFAGCMREIEHDERTRLACIEKADNAAEARVCRDE